MPDLLCPAGNPENLSAALRFGADAVYLAGKSFGMRSAADNFTVGEIKDAAAAARKQGAKIYLTVNVMPHGYEYPALKEYLYSLSDTGIDGVIAADLGVIALVREILPEVGIHVSTQASIVSAEAAEQYRRLGCCRAVLARELTLDEIPHGSLSLRLSSTAPCACHGAAGACFRTILPDGMQTAVPAPSPAAGIIMSMRYPRRPVPESFCRSKSPTAVRS